MLRLTAKLETRFDHPTDFLSAIDGSTNPEHRHLMGARGDTEKVIAEHRGKRQKTLPRSSDFRGCGNL
jgi:hypothetical protein